MKGQLLELMAAYMDLVSMYFAEIDISGIVVIALSFFIVVVLAFRYGKRRKKMKELMRQRRMLTARLDKLIKGRKKMWL